MEVGEEEEEHDAVHEAHAHADIEMEADNGGGVRIFRIMMEVLVGGSRPRRLSIIFF